MNFVICNRCRINKDNWDITYWNKNSWVFNREDAQLFNSPSSAYQVMSDEGFYSKDSRLDIFFIEKYKVGP